MVGHSADRIELPAAFEKPKWAGPPKVLNPSSMADKSMDFVNFWVRSVMARTELASLGSTWCAWIPKTRNVPWQSRLRRQFPVHHIMPRCRQVFFAGHTDFWSPSQLKQVRARESHCRQSEARPSKAGTTANLSLRDLAVATVRASVNVQPSNFAPSRRATTSWLQGKE